MTFEGVSCVVIQMKEEKLMIRITSEKSAIHHRGKILWVHYREVLDRKTRTPLFKVVWQAAFRPLK